MMHLFRPFRPDGADCINQGRRAARLPLAFISRAVGATGLPLAFISRAVGATGLPLAFISRAVGAARLPLAFISRAVGAAFNNLRLDGDQHLVAVSTTRANPYLQITGARNAVRKSQNYLRQKRFLRHYRVEPRHVSNELNRQLMKHLLAVDSFRRDHKARRQNHVQREDTYSGSLLLSKVVWIIQSKRLCR